MRQILCLALSNLISFDVLAQPPNMNINDNLRGRGPSRKVGMADSSDEDDWRPRTQVGLQDSWGGMAALM